MYFLYGCGLFYENVTHLVRLWLYYVRKCHLWSWSWQKILLFVCFGLNYMNYCLILFFGVSESSINCYCLILLVFLFVYLYLFGLNRSLKILFDLFWLPKSPLLSMPACIRQRQRKQLYPPLYHHNYTDHKYARGSIEQLQKLCRNTFTCYYI